jgi:hypothetical protein
MNLDGSQLGRAMMSIHEAEMEQAARYPGSDLSDRIERRVVLDRRRNRMLCWLGSFLVRIGRRLQQYGLPQPVPLEGNVTEIG